MKISQKLIDSALATHNKKILPLFCIVRDVQRNIIDGGERVVYSVVTEPNYRNSLEVTRKEARALIDLYGLVPCLQEKYGTIYDTENQSYRNRYRGHAVEF